MSQNQEHIDALKDIKSMMEKSTKFISLSGITGILVGALALVGSAIAYWLLSNDTPRHLQLFDYEIRGKVSDNTLIWLLVDAVSILVGALMIAFYFTKRKAEKLGQSLFDKSAKLMFYNMMLPLVAGGILCLIFLFKGMIILLAPLTLLFYGLALLNASNYTLNEVKYLGISEIILGLVSAMIVGQGLLFWALGFGVLHIVYGVVMYNKYDKQG